MAKFKKVSWTSFTQTGELLELKTDVNINVDGKFYFKVPQEYEDFVFKLEKERREQFCYDGSAKYDQYQSKNLFALSFNELEEIGKTLVTMKASSEVKKTLVILYKVENDVCFFKSKDGEILSDGDEDQGSYHEPNLDFSRRLPHYSVNIYAKVFYKITQTGSDKFKYDPYLDDDCNGKYLNLLNSFHSLTMRIDPEDYENRVYKEIPYTEDRAKFFYDMLIGMCKLADKFSALTDEKQLLKIADAGNGMLLTIGQGSAGGPGLKFKGASGKSGGTVVGKGGGGVGEFKVVKKAARKR